MNRIIECVPNFSEGNNMDIIKTGLLIEIKSVEGVKLIDIAPVKLTNRTVMNLFGTPPE